MENYKAIINMTQLTDMEEKLFSIIYTGQNNQRYFRVSFLQIKKDCGLDTIANSLLAELLKTMIRKVGMICHDDVGGQMFQPVFIRVCMNLKSGYIAGIFSSSTIDFLNDLRRKGELEEAPQILSA